MYIVSYQNASQKNNIIEIIGMPAVGKSTYMDRMIAENKSLIDINGQLPKSHFFRQLYKLYAIINMFFTKRKFMIKHWKAIWKTRQRTIKDFLAVYSNWVLIQFLMKNCINKKDITFVFDQGVFQALWSILFSASCYQDVMGLLKDAYMPGEIYFLDEADDILAKRESARKKRIRLNYSDELDVFAARKAINYVVEGIGCYYNLNKQ